MVLPMRARTCEEFKQAQHEWVDPGQCIIYADVEGQVGMLMRGRLPIRSGANAWLPVPGWSGDHEWQGDVPFEKLPQLSNPATHCIESLHGAVNRWQQKDEPIDDQTIVIVKREHEAKTRAGSH